MIPIVEALVAGGTVCFLASLQFVRWYLTTHDPKAQRRREIERELRVWLSEAGSYVQGNREAGERNVKALRAELQKLSEEE